MEQTPISVVKIGGNVVDNPEALRAFLADFAAMKGPKVLIHGGGKEATRLSKALDIPTVMVEGRRVTSLETLHVVTMVYAGLINKRIVSLLQSLGCDAVGLSGADGNAIPATRRPSQPVDFGYVGDIDHERINSQFILSLIDSGRGPVFCAICHDTHGTLLNCNADSVAASVARGLVSRPVSLTFCFEMPGVMTDVERPDSVIPVMTPALFDTMRANGSVAKGMVPKLQNAIRCAQAGVDVRICDAKALLTPDSGTRIAI